MEVILLKDVKGVGKKQQTVNVSDGYANNYLLPKKLAVKVSKKSIEVLAKEKEDERIAEENAIKEARINADKLQDITITFKLKTGEQGRVFGSISTKQISDALLAQYNINIDKRKFLDKGPFDSLGYYNLKIELYHGVVATIKLHIEGE